MTPSIHSLHIYPLKSCRSISLESAQLVPTGFQFDRHWMLVDQRGKFLSQRSHPAMAQIETRFVDDLLLCSAAGRQVEIPIHANDRKRIPVQIWNDQCSAAAVSVRISRWFSDFLNVECKLVYLPDNEKRQVDRNYAAHGQTVGFADGFPLLVVSLESMELLNTRLGESLSIDRFRPNIVIAGCAAHAEDEWSSLTVNGIRIELVKPCSRCVIPSIDQHSARKHPTLLRTLAAYRRHHDGKVYVGQNGLHRQLGSIRRGQAITFENRRPIIV